jgi:hypothetical protein
MAANGFDIGTEAARADDRAAERLIDVHHRRERPVHADEGGLLGNDARDVGGHLEVVDCRKRERVGHLRAEWQAHARALEVGADEQGNRGSALRGRYPVRSASPSGPKYLVIPPGR